MRELFRPFRRKLGVLTLLVACLFMGVWMRSYVKRDGVRSFSQSWERDLESSDGAIRCLEVKFADIAFGDTSTEFYSTDLNDGVDHDSFWQHNDGFVDSVSFIGFQFGEGKISRRHPLKLLSFPYWSIVIPMTAFAAWLLLSKLGQPKRADHA